MSNQIEEDEFGQLPNEEQIKEFVRSQTGGREPEVDCDAALDEGWNLNTCLNPRGTMQMIACIANRLESGEEASRAWRTAWKQAEQQCEDLGFQLRDLVGASTASIPPTNSSCDEIWQKVLDLDMDEMAERNAEISEQEGKEVGNRVCTIEDGPPSMGTETGLAMAECGAGEEVADHHHHTSEGGGQDDFSDLDVISMVGRDLDVSCITYPDDETMMQCADVDSVDDEVAMELQEAWDEYYPSGDTDALADVYDSIQEAREQMTVCTSSLPDIAAQGCDSIGVSFNGNGPDDGNRGGTQATEDQNMDENIEMEVEMSELAQDLQSEFERDWADNTTVESWRDGVDSGSTPCEGLAELGVISEGACAIDGEWDDGVNSQGAERSYNNNTGMDEADKWYNNWVEGLRR